MAPGSFHPWLARRTLRTPGSRRHCPVPGGWASPHVSSLALAGPLAARDFIPQKDVGHAYVASSSPRRPGRRDAVLGHADRRAGARYRTDANHRRPRQHLVPYLDPFDCRANRLPARRPAVAPVRVSRCRQGISRGTAAGPWFRHGLLGRSDDVQPWHLEPARCRCRPRGTRPARPYPGRARRHGTDDAREGLARRGGNPVFRPRQQTGTRRAIRPGNGTTGHGLAA